MSGPQRGLHGSTNTGEDYVPTTTYADGTTGWSGSSTSRERAEREVKGRRQQQVYAHLLRAGVLGRTCAEVEGDLGIGHGSASSALTGLHRGRHIVRLTQRRNGQEVYVVAHHQQGREESPYRPNSASKKALEEEVTLLRRQTKALTQLLWKGDPAATTGAQYTLMWEVEGDPRERYFDAESDAEAVLKIDEFLGRGWGRWDSKISDVRLMREVLFRDE